MQYIVILLLLLTNQLSASQWSNTSVSMLNGDNYELGDKHRTLLTYEHVSSWEYGDHFLFFDVSNPFSKAQANNTSLYGEWAPRFSTGKVFDFYNKDRLIQDVLLASTLEHGNSGFATRAFLYGVGLDLNIPHFKFLRYNFYIRDNPDKVGTTYQTTIVWSMPFKIESLSFDFRGYFDYVHGTEGSNSRGNVAQAHINTAPQLLFDLGKIWNAQDRIHIGIEYQFWDKKFGQPNGEIERNLQWMIKWVL
jgi:nucleoside-specific outer membrane channel protein Tsx